MFNSLICETQRLLHRGRRCHDARTRPAAAGCCTSTGRDAVTRIPAAPFALVWGRCLTTHAKTALPPAGLVASSMATASTPPDDTAGLDWYHGGIEIQQGTAQIPASLLSAPLATPAPGELRKQHTALAMAARSAVTALREAHCLTLARLVEEEEAARCKALLELTEDAKASSAYVAMLATSADAAAARAKSALPDFRQVLEQHSSALAQHRELAVQLTQLALTGAAPASSEASTAPARTSSSLPPLSRRARALVEAGIDAEMVAHMSEADVDEMWLRLDIGPDGAAPTGGGLAEPWPLITTPSSPLSLLFNTDICT